MNKLFKSSIIFTLACSLLLVGCSKKPKNFEEPPQKTAVTLIVSNTKNNPIPNYDGIFKDMLMDVILNEGKINIINNDGAPSSEFNQDYKLNHRFKKASKRKLNMYAEEEANKVIQLMKSYVPDDEEVDYLKSIQMAAMNQESATGYDAKKIYVFGSGLNTTGRMNFNNGLFNYSKENVTKLIDFYEEEEELAALKNTTVIFNAIGEVDNPQPSLSGKHINVEKAIYDEYITRSGGTFVTQYEAPHKRKSNDHLPNVTIINLPDDSLTPDIENLNNPYTFNEKLSFLPNEDTFVNTSSAQEQIVPLANFLKEHNDVKILLIGSVAGDTSSQEGQKLSEKRAEKVKKLLVDEGISDNRIKAIGLDIFSPDHIKNVGTESTHAQKNRSVTVLDMKSKMAQNILNTY